MTETPLYRHQYDSVIFDIDGTLWNAAQSTAVAWTKVFREHGISLSVTKKDIEGVAGRPYLECLTIIFPGFESFPHRQKLLSDLTENEQATMVSLGGEHYAGVLEGLRLLSRQFPLYLVSNCQDWYLEAFLKFGDVDKLVRDSTCYGLTKLPKNENIRNLMKKHDLKNPVYIGDTAGDKKAATEAGIDYLHVEYGFDRSLDGTGLKSFEDVVSYLLKGKA